MKQSVIELQSYSYINTPGFGLLKTMYISLGFNSRLFVAARQERCADRASQSDCEGWKKAGFCIKHESLVYHCKKTCNLCSSGKDLKSFVFLATLVGVAFQT